MAFQKNFIQFELNERLELSKVRLLFLKDHGIREYIGYPEYTLIFLHEDSSVNISEEDSKCLSDILSNNNELSIKTKKNNLERVSLKIDQKKLLQYLPLDVKLNEARLILNLSLECSDFGDNYLFKHPIDGKIDIEDESKMTLYEIIDKNDNSIKFSKTIDPNWRKLINLCEYGFTITNDISSNKGEKR